jgi:hypothetical protein
MAIHDWTRVDAGLFHAFHQLWISTLCGALNTGRLPPQYFALPEQSIRGPIPDVLTLHLDPVGEPPPTGDVGLAVASAPPRTRLVQRAEEDLYARQANRITVRHRHGEVVAVVEIVSPGNKGSQGEFDTFVGKTVTLIRQGIHTLVIDLLPPSRRDPLGIHKAIWDAFQDEEIALPVEKPLVLASYDAGPPVTAYVEPVAVGDSLPDMPLFLKSGCYVPVPLEATYKSAWGHFPGALKPLLEGSQQRPNGPP